MKNTKRMLALILTLITLFSVVSFAVQAEDSITFRTGGAEYEIINKTDAALLGYYSCPDEIADIPAYVIYDGDKYWVTEIKGIILSDYMNTVDITEIVIPYPVENISASIVNARARTFTVDKNNKYYYVDSYGVLYRTNNILVMYPKIPGNTYEIKNGTKHLGRSAFSSAYNLGDDALTAVYIPASVTFIGNNCFGLTALRKIFYGGTKEQWESIDKDLINEKLDRVQIVYNATGCVDSETCDCKCHASWLESIFFKLFNALAMFFGFGEPVCKCGVQH